MTAAKPEAANAGTQELTQDIERTREQLGETVEALIVRANVWARAKEKMSGAAARLWVKTGWLRSKTAHAGEASGELRAKAGQAGQQMTATAREHPLPLAAAGSAAIAGVAALAWWKRR